MKFLGSINFYSKYIRNIHCDAKPLYDLIRDDVDFKWEPQHQEVFDKIKQSLLGDLDLAIPNDQFPYFISVDASLVGIGAMLAQNDKNNKMKIVSYNSRVFTTQEQKMATIYRELTAIIYA